MMTSEKSHIGVSWGLFLAQPYHTWSMVCGPLLQLSSILMKSHQFLCFTQEERPRRKASMFENITPFYLSAPLSRRADRWRAASGTLWTQYIALSCYKFIGCCLHQNLWRVWHWPSCDLYKLSNLLMARLSCEHDKSSAIAYIML